MKSKVMKSSQLGIISFGCECSCGGDTYESNHYSSWSKSDECSDYHFKCEECEQEWILPKNTYVIPKLKRRKKSE